MADRLYTVNQWNKNQFTPTWVTNPFGVTFSKPNVTPYVNWSNPQQRAAALGTTAGLVNGFGQWNANGPFSGDSNTSNSSSPSGMGFLGGMAGGLGSMVGNAVGNAIGGGYSADGSGLVGGLMAGVQSVNTGIPWLDFAKNTVAGAATGIFNRGFGIKENKENIAAVEQNTLAARNAGNELAGSNSNNAILAASGNMVSGTGFSAGDLYKNGWFTSKGTKKGNAKLAAEQAALAAQTHGLTLGVQGADTALDDEVMGNFAAFGGPMDMVTPTLLEHSLTGDNGMGAIEYGFMRDWLLSKQEKDKAKSDMSISNKFGDGGEESTSKKILQGWYNALVDTPVKTVKSFFPERGYHGGTWSGAGDEGHWTNPDYYYNDIYPADTLLVPTVKTFNQAFAEARKKGLDTFEFNGGTYGTQLGDSPNWKQAGDARISEDIVPVIIPADTIRRRTNRPKEDVIHPKRVPILRAFGGDMQSNGGDFGTGAMHIGAGDSHEMNPYGGVQVGVDQEGVPNLVEEGEVIYNDYVYSQRIKLDEAAKEKFHFSKKKDITYADAAKKLEGEISERPNDPISKAGFKAQMAALAEEQERQKAEMEAERAREAFEALSPEEQVAVMESAAQQEQAAQQAAMQQEAMAQQQAQPSPEEQAMMQQQMMQADGSQAMVGQEPQMNAYGGKINRFDLGGEIMKMLGVHTWSDFVKWAKENKVDIAKDGDNSWFWDGVEGPNGLDWNEVLKGEKFRNALSKGNPALADALSKGYDFGAYIPGAAGNVTFDNDRGNWDMQTVQGWWGSQDPAWLEVIKNHPELTKDTKLDKKTLENYLSSTNAFKKGTEWLQASPENRLTYLQAILNNPNAPVRARQYAERFIDANGWKQGAATDYDTIFNNPSGRTANPGTYWKTPIEAVRNTQSMNLAQNANGDWEEVIGDVPTDWTPAGNYSWATPESDFTYNYYTRPAGDAAGTVGGAVQRPGEADKSPVGDGSEKNAERMAEKYAPMLRPEWPRYAGIAGPIVGLGMQLAGIGKPDTASIDAAVEGLRKRGARFIAPRYIGDYLGYRPMDIWAEQNRLNANSRGTERGILNSGASQGAKMAGLLASGYNDQIASGELYRKALEYNDAQLERRAAFNKDTNKTNMAAYNDAQKFNAEIANSDSRYNAQLALQAAREKNDLNAGWYNSIYGNMAGLFKGISDIGRENAQHNMIARMAADELFGNLGDSWTGRKYVRRR